MLHTDIIRHIAQEALQPYRTHYIQPNPIGGTNKKKTKFGEISLRVKRKNNNSAV